MAKSLNRGVNSSALIITFQGQQCQVVESLFSHRSGQSVWTGPETEHSPEALVTGRLYVSMFGKAKDNFIFNRWRKLHPHLSSFVLMNSLNGSISPTKSSCKSECVSESLQQLNKVLEMRGCEFYPGNQRCCWVHDKDSYCTSGPVQQQVYQLILLTLSLLFQCLARRTHLDLLF